MLILPLCPEAEISINKAVLGHLYNNRFLKNPLFSFIYLTPNCAAFYLGRKRNSFINGALGSYSVNGSNL